MEGYDSHGLKHWDHETANKPTHVPAAAVLQLLLSVVYPQPDLALGEEVRQLAAGRLCWLQELQGAAGGSRREAHAHTQSLSGLEALWQRDVQRHAQNLSRAW